MNSVRKRVSNCRTVVKKGRTKEIAPIRRLRLAVERSIRRILRYERGFNAEDVCELVRVIDGLMDLPSALAELFRQDLDKIQEEKRMPFVTSYERNARREGIRLGIETALWIRFGGKGLKLMPEIHEIHEEEKLKAILTALETAASPDEVASLRAANCMSSARWRGRLPCMLDPDDFTLAGPREERHVRRLRFAVEGGADVYFEAFLARLFPEVHRQIDWSLGYESLDKEFQQVVGEAEVRRRSFQGRAALLCWEEEISDRAMASWKGE